LGSNSFIVETKPGELTAEILKPKSDLQRLNFFEG